MSMLKVTLNNRGLVVVESQSFDESIALYEYAIEKQLAEKRKRPAVSEHNKKPKKHMHIKICDVCGRECKGNIGLNVHKNRAHKDIKNASEIFEPGGIVFLGDKNF